MLDIKFIRENPNKVKENLLARGFKANIIDDVLNKYEKKVEIQQKVDNLRNRLNEISRDPGWLKDGRLIQPAAEIKKELEPFEEELGKVEKEYKKVLFEIPNLILEDVPIGNESKNKVMKTIGKISRFSYKPKAHIEMGEALELIDIPRAVKISGTRFAFLKNKGVILELALVKFTIDRLVKEGFIPIVPPLLIKQNITEDLGYWHGGGNENYYLVSDFEDGVAGTKKVNPLYLIGTAEHAIVSMHKDEVFSDKELPKKYVGFSPCFRREAGTYGKDTKGIFRVHQFDKIEMVAFIKPEDDEKERRKLLSLVESLMKSLGLPYRSVKLASEDLSFPSAETIDIETWIPSENKYRETHSISTTTDFQARRLNIKYRTIKPVTKVKEGQVFETPLPPQKEFVHILNGTAFAIGRTLIAIMENYQTKDGSIEIPKILQKYAGFTKIPSQET